MGADEEVASVVAFLASSKASYIFSSPSKRQAEACIPRHFYEGKSCKHCFKTCATAREH
jgi:hypothetical protein